MMTNGKQTTKKRVLFCATVDYHFKAFHIPYLKWFKEQGWEVHIAASGNLELPFVDEKYDIPIQRSPFKVKNLTAYNQLKETIDNNQYQIIHCHTPMGGVLARIAARAARKNGTKVIYTAHGFHFCKGAPLVNWLLYYPIERMLASYTDCLITINSEDYNLSKSHGFKAGVIEHVHGVGVNTDVYRPVDQLRKNMIRRSFGYSPEDFLLLYAAEFNKNKNQQLLINAFTKVKGDIPNAKLLLAGEGPLLEECKALARKLGIDEYVHFLGLRNDVELLVKMSDLAVASSLREGLPVNILEAMACGLPVVATENRGHRELVKNNETGFINNPLDVGKFASKIIELAQSEYMRNKLGKSSRLMIEQNYGVTNVLDQKSRIYRRYMKEMEELKWAAH